MHTKIKWSKSISTNLIKWFLLLSLTPIIIISYLAYKNSSESLYKGVTEQLEHSASSYINFIENWFYYRESDTRSWSSSKNTLAFMDTLNETFSGSKKTPQAYVRSLQYTLLIEAFQDDLIDLTRQYDYIYDIFLISEKGDLLYTVAKEDDLGTNLINGKYASTFFAKSFKESLKDGKIHFSDFENYAPSNNGVYGFLTTPIVDESGDVTGVFAIQLKLHRIYEPFDKINKEDNGISHYLLGGEDLLLRTSINDDKEILKKRVQTVQTELYQNEHVFKLIEEHQENIHFYTGPNRDKVIGEHHPLEILGVKWALISEINKDYALASSYALAYKLLIFSLLAIFIVVLSAFFVAKRITKPIEILANASETIFRGKERKTVWVKEENEIGILADSFNDLIHELNQNDKMIAEQSFETQKALNELSEQKLALDAHAIVAITDIEGNITYSNAKLQQISGYEEYELLGRNHRMLNSGLHPREFWTKMYDTISHGNTWHGEVRNRTKAGTFYWIDTTIVPFLNDKGEVKSYIAIRTDITEQKEYATKLLKAKEDAEQGARAKAEFLASMSHEIRTPMNGVIGMLGLLKNSELNQTQTHQVSLAESSAQSLLTLINDILDFSKVEAGKLELEELEFNLRDDLGDFAEAIAFRAQENGVELILDVKKIEHVQIISDPGRLRQILSNLVGNAIKFTHEGEILISCEVKSEDDTKGRLYITIKDSGIGIPREKISTLFDSFTQVDSSTTRKYGGTGLGLSIVKQLVELMGGSISVESELTKGSTFSFNIAVGLHEHPTLVIPRVPVKGKRVLVVDDNAVNREVVREQLVHWGMKVYEAEGGDKALEICQEQLTKEGIPPFDIALVDMHMPHMDGAELAKILRATPEYDKMKMVMMTSLGSRGDAKIFADIGFNAYFPKPTTTKDLFNALNVLIEDSDTLHQSGDFLTKDKLHAMIEPETITPWPKETRILLVEDNMTNQIVANGILETFGLQADVANNGEEAIHALKQALKTVSYTLVLMDCQMPVMDGYHATENIRLGAAGDENIKIPIIAMTANAMKGDREHCISVGMDDYLSKPINPDTLNAVLSKWLKNAKEIV